MTSTFDGPFIAVPKWAIDRINKQRKGSALHVLCNMIEHMDLRTKSMTVSAQDIAEQTGLSRETVKRTIKWLESEGILTVRRNDRQRPNTYRVQYAEVGSPMTLPRVTHDPTSGVQPVGGGVTHDPTSMPKNHQLPADMQNTIEIHIDSSNKKKMKRVSDATTKGTDVILGGDTDGSWEAKKEQPRRKRQYTTEVVCLADQFRYHPSRLMNTTYSQKDLAILKRQLRRMLENGVTKNTISKMIDRYLSDTRFVDRNPIFGFCSHAVQEKLLTKVNSDVIADHPVLDLMLNDFVRRDEELPWEPSEDVHLQKAIMMRCIESTYRYPELVAGIALRWSGSFDDRGFLADLSALEQVVRNLAGMSDEDITAAQQRISYLDLPKDFRSGKVRPPAGTMVTAIYQYRRSTHV